MESRTYIRNQKITPKKLRFMLESVKKESPVVAMQKLMYTPRKGARMLYKAIQSAVSNAKNTLKVEGDMLQFKTLLIEEGQKLKRMRAGGRGMAKPFKRKYSHIKIILIAKDQEVKSMVKSQDVKPMKEKEVEEKSKVKSQKSKVARSKKIK